VRVIGYRPQRTLGGTAEVAGAGFISGACVRVRFLPAPADAGVVFRRVDLPGRPAVAAHVSQVTGTQRRTTLGPPQSGVTLVEHLMAALAGLRIDNCTVEVDGPEPPGLDGSALGFVRAIAAAGAVIQPARRAIRTVDEPVVVSDGGATLALHPSDGAGLRVSYVLDYGLRSPLGRQTHTLDATAENLVREVASCRTFLTEPEAEALRAQGIGTHLGPAEVLVFGPRGPIGNRLRFADEPARHKVLDLIGDLALCGFDLAGHVVAYRSGHTLNAELTRRLAAGAESSSRQVVKPSSRLVATEAA
jgi:UDP-3-O-acyl N-acetylglucosamine deacetylase